MTNVAMQLDIVAIVPARGGSKRLPRKNVLPLAGKPLINWTLDAAKESGVIDLIVVTSDDDEVLSIAGAYEDVQLISRPVHLATDTATSIDTVLHSLGELEKQGITAKRVMLLQPTSPLRRAEDIRNAAKRMDDTGAASVISVCEMEHSPLWSNTLPVDGCMNDFFHSGIRGLRSQELPVYYRLNGAIYLTGCCLLKRSGWFDSQPCFALYMSRYSSVDIDDALDFSWAEHLIATGEC